MKKLSLALSVLLFLITTYLVIGIPMSVPNKFDLAQKLALGIVGITGYFGSVLYFVTYKMSK